ncbi:aromatic-ring-hydroxylating dioxygenase subunit beta [Roseicella aquatilis]|uniref:Uncharacterized protein n=1 Tax=Roseicella aquatilis TaxID=2527868 RepID=A0A4V2WLW9_9PROT|nr:aromatic-ring-hydroxylating dioxygenase subunit beta [Roseicella aquatilis]TCZ64985.1 hypothetical protein EXY23_06340 [Roseicella aquatilis]
MHRKDWDAWLACYAPDAESWMPCWDDDKLTEDPQTEISLIWYGDRGGLKDSVFRIRTERSSTTSLPEPPTGRCRSVGSDGRPHPRRHPFQHHPRPRGDDRHAPHP